MPPTFLIYLFVVTVLPVLLVLGAIFGLCYGLYRWRRRRKRRVEGADSAGGWSNNNCRETAVQQQRPPQQQQPQPRM